MKKLEKFLILFFCTAWLFIANVGYVSDRFTVEPKLVFTDKEAYPWSRVELLADDHPAFVQEAFSPQGRQLDPLIRKWFNDCATPHSKYFLLHCAKDFDKPSFPNPVLLVHGAGDNANRAWIHPFDPILPSKELPLNRQGFAIHLSNLGYSVFAITFAHNQGCNILQAEHVANAIRRIRVLLKRENDPSFKVDIIAHSKGNVAVRLYCSDGRAIFPSKDFLSSFRRDVRRYIAIAAPMKGVDIPYRYYLYNIELARKGNVNAPFGADKLFYAGSWFILSGTHTSPGFYDAKTYFPGQCQIMFNLVRDGGIPLGIESMTPVDFNDTAYKLYHGGTSLYMSSSGIDSAINAGERLIYRLEERGLDSTVELGVIAGKNPFISYYVEGLGFIPMPHELLSAPMDGVVFLKSATSVEGSLKRGAKLIKKVILDLNHLAIACSSETLRIIDDLLRLPSRSN